MTSFSSQIRYTSKRMQQFAKFVRCFLIRNRTALLWFVRKAPGYRIAAFFAKRATIFAKCAAIRRTCRTFTAKGTVIQKKAPQSLDCSALQDGALRHGHKSAALLVGEKQHTRRHVFKCRHHGAFVALFLTYTIYTSRRKNSIRRREMTERRKKEKRRERK